MPLRQPKTVEIGLGSLVLGDALDFLSGLQPNSVDLIISSPPYFMGKEYDTSLRIEDFIDIHKRLLPLLLRALKNGGNLCWQVGHHVRDGVSVPLDCLIYQTFSHEMLFLRNRIVWTFGHGVHARRRLSGRHESILWYSKGKDYFFDLDAIRVPQKYPGKRHYKGPKKGELSGNPLGKNPSDVWDIPNVKAGHIEKTEHPCQFPVALVQRLVRGLSPKAGLIVDPFMGSGTTAAVAQMEGRKFSGCDSDERYFGIAVNRVRSAASKSLKHRPVDVPVFVPTGREAVSRKPDHFWEKKLG